MGVRVAIIGSGNIGTDLMMKVLRTSTQLEMGAFAGIDPESDGLARARRLGVPVTSDGIDTRGTTPSCAAIRSRSSISRPQPLARTWCRP